jgi:GntR family transcriptional repressor for pyruvate dehydrogenase complex
VNTAAIVSKIDSLPAYKLVYEAIEELIVSGELPTGSLLPIEGDLAQQFGVNRSTIREGIRLLEQSGLVERAAAKRLAVSRPPLDRLASRAGRALLLHQVTFSELWETLMAIEPATAGLAAARATDEMISRLSRNLEQMKGSEGRLERFIELDVEFHDLIAEAANNRAMTLARESSSLLILPSGVLILPKLKTYKRVIDIHGLVLKAVKKHDAEEATKQMRRHLADFKRGYELAGFRPDETLVGAVQNQKKRNTGRTVSK